MSNYKTRAAQELEASGFGYGGKRYADYIEASTLETAEKRPDLAEYILNMSLGEALSGNDGA